MAGKSSGNGTRENTSQNPGVKLVKRANGRADKGLVPTGRVPRVTLNPPTLRRDLSLPFDPGDAGLRHEMLGQSAAQFMPPGVHELELQNQGFALVFKVARDFAGSYLNP